MNTNGRVERDRLYAQVRIAAARSGRTWSDVGGMFSAAATTAEGREAIEQYKAAVKAVRRILQGTRYSAADPEYI